MVRPAHVATPHTARVNKSPRAELMYLERVPGQFAVLHGMNQDSPKDLVAEIRFGVVTFVHQHNIANGPQDKGSVIDSDPYKVQMAEEGAATRLIGPATSLARRGRMD